MNPNKNKKWTIFCGYLTLSILIQNALSYYIVINCYLTCSTSFFMTICMIGGATKLLWIIVQSYYFIKSLLEEFSIVLTIFLFLFSEICPLIIFAFSLIIDRDDDDDGNRHDHDHNEEDEENINENTQCKQSTIFFMLHSFISLPMTVIYISYLIFYPNASNISFYICCIAISLNILSLIIISSNFWKSISMKINVYYATCCILDVFHFMMRCYFLSIFFYEYDTNKMDNIWYYSSIILLIKTFIISPLYGAGIFLFEFVNEIHESPHNLELATKIYYFFCPANNRNIFCLMFCVPLIVIVYLFISIYLLLYLWIIGDCIFYSYSICIFQAINDNLWINSKGFDLKQNKWRNVMKYMNNSINSYDYSLRMFLLNYSFFIFNQNAYSKNLLHSIQKGIKWYITDEEEANNTNKKKLRFYPSNSFRNNTPKIQENQPSNSIRIKMEMDKMEKNNKINKTDKKYWSKMEYFGSIKVCAPFY